MNTLTRINIKTTAIALTLVFWGMLLYAQSTVTYTFDKQGRLKSEYYESVYLVQFTYDVEGNFQSKTVANYINNVQEAISDKLLKMHPNPASDHVVIEVPKGTRISNINICDITGKALRQIKKPEVPIILQVKHFKSGLYFIEIESVGKTEVFKLIKN